MQHSNTGRQNEGYLIIAKSTAKLLMIMMLLMMIMMMVMMMIILAASHKQEEDGVGKLGKSHICFDYVHGANLLAHENIIMAIRRPRSHTSTGSHGAIPVAHPKVVMAIRRMSPHYVWDHMGPHGGRCQSCHMGPYRWHMAKLSWQYDIPAISWLNTCWA